MGLPVPRIACCPGTHPSVAPAAPRTAPLSPQSNKIEKAVSAAHTFLQKNPKHEMTLKYLNYYRTMVDVDEYLVDLEAQPYEVRRGWAWVGEEKEEEHPTRASACPAEPIPNPKSPSSRAPSCSKKHLWGQCQGWSCVWRAQGSSES